MAFLATLQAAYRDATSRAANLKKLAQSYRNNMEAGAVSADIIKGLMLSLIAVKAANQATAALPGIAAYAKAQEGDSNYDVAAQWTAMNNAIDTARDQILSDVPTGTGGFRLVETWTTSGVEARTFTTVQTSNLRITLDALIATIN